MSPCKELVFIADRGFYKEALKNSQRLLDYKKVKVISVDHFDSGKDVNDIGRDPILEEVELADELTFSKLIQNMI